ncbi:protein spaetzle-like isoform X2 [Sabethes cyaneus]|uniref:protein spaetzle-like isoform X2 n=1 Tax=Sabethes cyaneus TaxID=53552 RepID=UPI00237E4B84|nr:protein spaetzle-like isoform X2 [Sabethes cyaneus]
MEVPSKQVATKGSQTVGYLSESANGNIMQRISWPVWLSSGLLIVVLFFSTIMLMVTVRSSPHNQYAAPHEKPIQSAPEVHPLVRTRQVTTTTENTSDEVVQTRIQEVFKRPGYTNPDPDPEDYPEETATAVTTRLDSPSRNRVRRPVKIGKDFDPKQSYVIKHQNGSISYIFPESISTPLVDVGDATEKPNKHVTFRTSSAESNEFVFPDGIPALERIECGGDDLICSNVTNYPEEKIDEIMAQHGLRYSAIFGNDVVIPNGDKLMQRFDFPDEEFLCASEERLVHPKSGKNQQNQEVTIVNTATYIQGVRVETCRSSGKACDNMASGSLYKTECRQLYHYRTLLAINPINNQPYKEHFRLPSCCKCVRISTAGALLREQRNADGL